MTTKKLKLFMLLSGQEVLAELVHAVDPECSDAFIIKHALITQWVPVRGTNEYMIGFLPLSTSNEDGEQRIYNRAVAAESIIIPKDIADAYIKRTAPPSVILRT